MSRVLSLALLFACAISLAIAQPGTSRDGPLISLYPPRGFPAEKIVIRYFMTGPFGGYGSFVRAKPDHQTIDFVAAVDGKPADRIKLIAYLPGCELVVLDFPLTGTAMWRNFDCRPLSTITLHGRIPPAYMRRKAQVAISYQADWAFDFFGFRDGIAVVFPLVTVVPNNNGEFSAAIPDFYKQKLGKGAYVLGFNCANCTDRSGRGPESQKPLELPVAAFYPPLNDFNAAPPN